VAGERSAGARLLSNCWHCKFRCIWHLNRWFWSIASHRSFATHVKEHRRSPAVRQESTTWLDWPWYFCLVWQCRAIAVYRSFVNCSMRNVLPNAIDGVGAQGVKPRHFGPFILSWCNGKYPTYTMLLSKKFSLVFLLAPLVACAPARSLESRQGIDTSSHCGWFPHCIA
jgi:hypothetical protein